MMHVIFSQDLLVVFSIGIIIYFLLCGFTVDTRERND